MTREDRIRIQHRAQRRKEGASLPIDDAEGRVMADEFLAGFTVQNIATFHGVDVVRAQRRLYVRGVYRAVPAARRAVSE